MLSTFPVSLAVGTLLGFLSGLGVGGGSLLILWLTLVLQMPQQTARMINLMFFLPAAVVACCFRLRQKLISPRVVLPAIASGCLAAVAGLFLSDFLDASWMKKLFGILLLITGLREITWKPKA